ncbi:hypothetical protein HYFRA_00011453 [Hymenoscyphus fraxineus]|uniref:Uncharacterized protein n=1 Tax=Hymenoscyphus fraxineus TaxID=746836 RepID=A0A9N9PXB4_9HELO|nr:hypothetical protein HYFRA_00011453 [Hymenoscyphus fraxineus]
MVMLYAWKPLKCIKHSISILKTFPHSITPNRNRSYYSNSNNEMEYTLFLASALATLATAMPTTPNIAASDPFTGYRPLTLTFHGGPSTYTLNMAADGSTYYTNNKLNVNTIEVAEDFNLWGLCNFYTTGPIRITTPPAGSGKTVQLGPPQPITAVACKPTANPPGYCLPVYASCEWCGGGLGGCSLSACCTGFCAATKCRPFPPIQT